MKRTLSCVSSSIALALALMGTSLVSLSASAPAYADASQYFRILVQDADTGRGVPLVELRTVNNIRFVTDSNGIIALNDPDLLGQTIYFHIKSPGYSYPKDGFGYQGVALKLAAGGKATVKIKRENIAERLYRLTGGGIYRDSVLTGDPIPLKQPLLNGQVEGQDTVMVTPYKGKLYWFFGDTDRPSYPLGQFATSGATSLLPGKGGLDPSVGADLTYWVDQSGFSRPMIPIKDAHGPVWVGGLFTIKDHGQERLLTHFAEVDHTMKSTLSGLAMFNDDKAVFEQICTYSLDDPLHPEGEPFPVRSGDTEYLYFLTQQMGAFPLVRNLPELSRLTYAATYEGFTCLAPGTRFRKEATQLDRGADGRLIWGWKKNTPALGEDEAKTLVSLGKMKQDEVLTQLRDIETDAFVTSHGGSVFWNPYRKRWILITTQAYGSPSFLGEVWFAEADTPTGPWLYARKVATHDHYTFYNPTQHPFFDQDGGRLIYFEGTYTNTFSDVKDLTPRYNYNQLMYRLSLDDPRLALPVPVYQWGNHYGTREAVEASQSWSQITAIPFYAVPADRPHEGLILVPTGSTPPFYALPPTPQTDEKPSPAVVPLYEYRDSAGQRWYAPEDKAPPSATRSAQPVCRVWRNPSSLLALDYAAMPLLMMP